jgi:hypothetical protein
MTNKITPGDVNWLDVDNNNIIDSRDQVYLGNVNPNVIGGLLLPCLTNAFRSLLDLILL